MQTDRDPLKLAYRGGRGPGLLTKVIATIVSAVVLIGAVAISFVLFAVALTVVVAFGVYLWWRTRHLRRQMRSRSQAGDDIIEGEVIRRDDEKEI